MIKFPCQFHGYKKTTLGDTIISLRVDELYADGTLELAGKKIGTEFVLHLEDVTNDTNIYENNKDVRDKFWSKMHGLINLIAEMRKTSPEDIKNKLRDELREKNLLKDSTTELDIKGLAIACNILERWQQEQS